MKRLFTILFAAMLAGQAWAAQNNYDFSATCSSGQTLYYKKTSENTVQITYPSNDYYDPYYHFTKPKGILDIPQTVNDNGATYSVTSIGEDAFYECSELASIEISNSVISIGSGAFYGC